MTVDEGDDKNWVIKDIKFGNVHVPPESKGERARRLKYEAEAAAVHRARFARTIMGGPGNHSSIHGCYCGEEYNAYDRTQTLTPDERYAAHIGRDARLVRGVLAVGDAFYDAVDHPGNTTWWALRSGETMRGRLEGEVADFCALTSDPALVETASAVLRARKRGDEALGRLYDLVLVSSSKP